MSKGAWRYDALERNTKLIREFCGKYKFELKELTQYQFRIEGLMDVYPVRQRWHWLATDERGTFANQNDLKAILLERLPDVEQAKVTIDKPKFEIAPPKMSWDTPIEEEILGFVRSMKNNMRVQQSGNLWRRGRREAECYANAYETVEKHIVKEIELRNSIKKNRHEL